MILQRFKQFGLSAVEKIQKGIDVMLNLGMSLNHSDVMFVRTSLSIRSPIFLLFWEGKHPRYRRKNILKTIQ